MEELTTIYATLSQTATAAGLNCGPRESEYGGWKPVNDSPLLSIARQVSASIYGEAPSVYSIHAGLELGELVAKFEPGTTQAISLGPDVVDVHSPAERLDLASTERFYKVVRTILQVIATTPI